MRNEATKFKQEILNIKDTTKLAHFISNNNIDIMTDDKELVGHFEKYLNFGESLDDKEHGIIFDLRNKR